MPEPRYLVISIIFNFIATYSRTTGMVKLQMLIIGRMQVALFNEYIENKEPTIILTTFLA